MIQGRSNFVYRIEDEGADKGKFVSFGLKDKYTTTPIHVDVNIVSADILDIEAFKAWRPEYENAEFILENGQYKCGWAIEKMSKSMFNVVNPDMIVEKYGADTLRLYEMFLGPVEQSKPWDTNGIDGCHRFLRKFWNLYQNGFDEGEATPENLKSVHKLIKKVSQDIETFSYNTSISAFMICVNELTTLKCSSREVLEPLVKLLSPFAPHISEELWHILGNESTVCDASWPQWNEEYLKESTIKYTVMIKNKPRYSIEVAAGTPADEVQRVALSHEVAEKWLEGGQPKKVIVVPNKLVNIVI
jgi:leucyl-tRNA synthetase